jgi:hypothetical protein
MKLMRVIDRMKNMINQGFQCHWSNLCQSWMRFKWNQHKVQDQWFELTLSWRKALENTWSRVQRHRASQARRSIVWGWRRERSNRGRRRKSSEWDRGIFLSLRLSGRGWAEESIPGAGTEHQEQTCAVGGNLMSKITPFKQLSHLIQSAATSQSPLYCGETIPLQTISNLRGCWHSKRFSIFFVTEESSSHELETFDDRPCEHSQIFHVRQ